MNPLRRTLALLSGLLLSGITLVALAPMASAYPDPPAPGGTGVPIQTPPPVVESAAGSGLPTWAVALIATGAAHPRRGRHTVRGRAPLHPPQRAAHARLGRVS